MTSRPSWDEYFLLIAQAVARRSSCPRAAVGAVIVSPEHRILATGYNGSPPGDPHCLDVGCLMVDNHCRRALHAEANAIAHAARHGVSIRGARLYVHGRDVCANCAQFVRAAGLEVAMTDVPR